MREVYVQLHLDSFCGQAGGPENGQEGPVPQPSQTHWLSLLELTGYPEVIRDKIWDLFYP